ncbi:MAG: hypothetical protein HYZ08_01905 [Candidatus Kerfeldbacteria bacterium]|nr:hypothetical protein [Candidatus Kerfeldbacteria bacterium]
MQWLFTSRKTLVAGVGVFLVALGIIGYAVFSPQESSQQVLGMSIEVPPDWEQKKSEEIPSTVRYQPSGATVLFQHRESPEAIIGFAVKETNGQTSFDQESIEKLRASYADGSKGDLQKLDEKKINGNPALELIVDITVQAFQPGASTANNTESNASSSLAQFRVRRALMIIGDQLITVTASAPEDIAGDILPSSVWEDMLKSISEPSTT